MARDSKIEVAAINIRIHEEVRRDYIALIEKLHSLKRGANVYGDGYIAISVFDPNTGDGLLSKYTEIDIDGQWFDLDDFDITKPEILGEIKIPESLRPNHSYFYFKIDPEIHTLAFSSYAQSKSLSTRSVARYFKEALKWPEISERFGPVSADVVKSFDEVQKLLSLPDLREIRITIRRPNPDGVDKDLADVIEKRMREQNGDEYQERLKAKGEESLQPNPRTKRLADLSVENGELNVKSLVKGVKVPQSTKNSPLREVETYTPDQSEWGVFRRVSRELFDKVIGLRRKIRE